MSRYCELKLIDVLKPEMSVKRSKTATDLRNISTKNRCTRTKLGNLSLLKSKPDKLCDNIHVSGLGETKPTKKSSNPTNSNKINKEQDIDVGDVGILTKSKPELSAGKRKRDESKIGNALKHSTKKICSDKSSHTSSRNVSSNPDQKITQRRKRKRKSRESCWENKLTGARRVSKRLSNLRIEKKKLLKNLGSSVNTLDVLIKSKQPVTFSARGKIKANEDVYEKSSRRVKPLYKKNRQEVQINFGKLSHTMRLYPKIAAGRNRRPATYTVTIKPTGSIQQNSGNITTLNEQFMETDTDEESSDPDDNSLISKCEDVQDAIVSETEKTPESNQGVIEDKEKDMSIDESQFNETTDENGFEEINQGNDVQTLLCSSIEEYSDGSTIVIVDIESGESIECQSEESQGKEQNTEFDESKQEIESAENLPNTEKTSEATEVMSVINFKASKNYERSKNGNSNSNSSKTSMTETNLETETEDKKNRIIVGSSIEPLTTEVVGMTNTTVEVGK